MKQAKIISHIFGTAAIILLCVMCSVVSYLYRSILCATWHGGGSAPASLAFLFAIPFIIGTGICFALYLFFKKKADF